MIGQNEIEEIISLINNGADLELLSFELDIPIEQIQSYKEQLELRKSIKEDIKSGTTSNSIEKLNVFIENNKNNIVERLMLIKLEAYANKTDIDREALQEIETEKQRIGFLRDIDEILNELKVQIPKRKSSNIRKKERQKEIEQGINEEYFEEVSTDENIIKPDYEELIKRYREQIIDNPQDSLSRRNLLAFTYFRAGKIEEARNELLELIEQFGSHTAYRQLVHLEKTEGNLEDAKLWAYEGIDAHPDSIEIREQLISIAKEEQDNQEIVKLLREIININPLNEKNIKRLNRIISGDER